VSGRRPPGNQSDRATQINPLARARREVMVGIAEGYSMAVIGLSLKQAPASHPGTGDKS